MKKLFIYCAVAIGLSAGLTSCGTVALQTYGEYGSVTDYSKYDVFISEATSVSFDYVPMGSVTAYVESGYDPKESGKVSLWGPSKKEIIKATSDDAVRVLVQNAKEIGANGIINVKSVYKPIWNETMKDYIGTYTATGMAIKK